MRVKLFIFAAMFLAQIAHAADSTLKPAFTWADRRPIAALHLADDFHRSPTNPAGWFQDASIDVLTPSGVAALRARAMAWADGAIKVMKEIDAQGMIIWEIDGCRFGSYLGCPDQSALLNPEMGGLADDLFARFRAQRFKVGVCIRPVEIDLKTGELSPAADPYATLLRKARYCRQRWKCRIFYIDSNLYFNAANQPQALLPSTLFARLHQALPDCLWIPEHEKVWGVGCVDEGYYLHTAPYQELRSGDRGTPSALRAVVPGAFAVLNVSEGDIESNLQELITAAKAGDIFMVNGWWRSEQIEGLLRVKKAATPTTQPVVTP